MFSTFTSFFWPEKPVVTTPPVKTEDKIAVVSEPSIEQAPATKTVLSIVPPVAKLKQTPEQQYEERVAAYKAATQGLSSLFKHILYVLNKDNCSAPSSIAAVLKSMGSSAAEFKGLAIHSFNAGHRGNNCPFFKTTSLKPSLHLGTTRIWNKEDGSIDEDRWSKLITATAEENNTIITKAKLQDYLTECAKNDPEEKDTGRHTSPGVPLSKEVQVQAAVLAWNEVFDRLAGGWKVTNNKTGEMEPYIAVSVAREFFEDSPVAYLRAECGLLPVPKPEIERVLSPVCVRAN